PGRFDPLFYRVDDGLVGTVPPTLSLRATVERLVAGVSATVGVGDSRLTGAIATRFYEDAMAYARQHAPLLARLAARYRLGVVSNFYGNLDAVCDELGLAPYLTVTVDSTAVGCRKPDARIFRHALDRLHADPAAAAFVGDSLARDMMGARTVG